MTSLHINHNYIRVAFQNFPNAHCRIWHGKCIDLWIAIERRIECKRALLHLRLICHWHQCAVTATPIPGLAVLYHPISPAELSWVHFPMTADDPALPWHPDNTSPDGEYLYSGDTSPHPQICIPPPVCVETPTPSHQEAMWHQISLNGKPPAGGISGVWGNAHPSDIWGRNFEGWAWVL